jgi:uncharacterized protein
MDFFVYSRDAHGTQPLRGDRELLERHWSYMDGFAETMIARGPTLGPDRETATGSLHVLGLPNVDAARDFVAGEPNHQAGVYAEHSIWRFENLLGRTMWEFVPRADEPRFLLMARPAPGTSPPPPESFPAELGERLILYGGLSPLDGAGPAWVAVALQAPNREAVEALLETGGLGHDALPVVEIHDWEFGGRR